LKKRLRLSPLKKVFELSQSSDVTDGDVPSVTDEEVSNDDDSDDADMTSVPSRIVGEIEPSTEECEGLSFYYLCGYFSLLALVYVSRVDERFLNTPRL
jgi:hypothetical protein